MSFPDSALSCSPFSEFDVSFDQFELGSPPSSAGSRSSGPNSNFLVKLIIWMLDHPGSDAIRWTTGGRFLVILNEQLLQEEVGQRLFKQKSVGSLYRQLNIYRWRRVTAAFAREAGDEDLPSGKLWQHEWLTAASTLDDLGRVKRQASKPRRSSRASSISNNTPPFAASPFSMSPFTPSPLSPSPSTSSAPIRSGWPLQYSIPLPMSLPTRWPPTLTHETPRLRIEIPDEEHMTLYD